MKNIVPNTISGVQNSAELIKGGLDQFKAVLKMHYSDAEEIDRQREAFVVANGDYEQCKLIYAAHRAIMLPMTTEARSLSMIVRELLKPMLGARFGRAWDGTGFRNSLETPRSFGELTHLSFMLSQRLAQYTEEENPPLAFMAKKADDLQKRMKAANMRLVSLEADLSELLGVRTEKMKGLRRYLRVVIDELHFVLEPMDRRWEVFGLNRPGSKETPDVPEKVAVNVIENKRGNVTWPRSARAEYYHVWLRVVGGDAEPVSIGSPRDPNFMLEELPQASEMEIFVSAVNSGGESRLSEAVRLVTGSSVISNQ